MKMMFALFLVMHAVACSACADVSGTKTAVDSERIGWIGSSTNGAIDCARRLHFTGLVIRGENDKITASRRQQQGLKEGLIDYVTR